MTETRFHCKTKNTGITVTLGVIVMLLLLTASCGKEKKEVIDVIFDSETTFTMQAKDVSSLISDSGITRYRMNAKEWLIFGKAEEPYWFFPKGVYVEKFDTLFNTEASIKADTAYFWEKLDLWKLVSNVEIENLEGERFETSLLFWSEKEERIWSDQFIRIEREGKVITGIGFESNQTMTDYKIFNSTGDFPIKEMAADSDQVEE